MKRIFVVSAWISICAIVSCNTSQKNTPHKGGNKTLDSQITLEWDSTVIDIFYTSGRGNFFMKDSTITFADHYYAKIYNYDVRTKEMISSHFGLGNGPNELQRFFYATPIKNDTSVFIVDDNINVSLYGNHYQLDKKGIINFHWLGGDKYSGEYESSKVYNFMLKTDFGVNIYKKGKDLIIPLQPVIPYACENGIITREHYEKSHIFGLLDINTLEINKVFGHYSPYYLEKSLPHYNSFSYVFDNEIFYVNFPVDSLIYVYKYPDKLLYSFGFECQDIVRKYTPSNTIKDGNYKDFQHCGMNTEILHFPAEGLFFRTYIKNMETLDWGMQIYSSTTYDLLADVDVPKFFKLLGYYDSCFYGVGIVPTETDNNTFVTFYKVKISL